MNQDARIFIAGSRGLVGSAIVRRLENAGATRLLMATREQLDLRDQAAVNYWFRANRPEYVYLAAGTVGGIFANSSRPAEFIYDNMLIHATVVHAAHQYGVKKLLYLGSSCIYPRMAPQPMKEEHLLTGLLEPTNEPYAIAKIAGIKLCEAYRRQYGANFISAMPTNLYGQNDNFDLTQSHVLPALIRKFHDAKVEGKPEVTIWGTGNPRREFLHVDDLADACVFLMDHYDELGHINVGTGEDLSIRELADAVKHVIYPGATLRFDTSKPDGPPRKLLDVSRLHALGWRHRIPLHEGLASTYEWFLEHHWPALDLACGFAYLVYVGEYMGIAFFLFFRRRFDAVRTLSWAFLLVNLLGFVTYFIYPAAPPWYVAEYGLGPARLDVHSVPAAASRFDQLLGTHFFDQIYGRGIDVYGAYPSLHVAYPLIAVWVAFRNRELRWARAPALLFFLLICLSAVYLQHHYVIDVLLGMAYAIVTLALVTRVPAAIAHRSAARASSPQPAESGSSRAGASVERRSAAP